MGGITILIKPKPICIGDTIGIIAPCFALTPDYFQPAFACLQEKGFHLKYGKNLFKATYGYAATPQERADDFNAMIVDPEVKMLFFDGGEVCNELLPYIDFKAVRENPKIIASYSDSTILLNAASSLCDLVTYYGQSPGVFNSPEEYNEKAFEACFMEQAVPVYEKSAPWQVLQPGIARGRLIGGYLPNFALMLGSAYLKINRHEKYILFLEDHECFNIPAALSRYLSHITQSPFWKQVAGVIFGNYSGNPCPQLNQILTRLGESYHIPVVKCEDFGHGKYHAVLPIGIESTLDTVSENLIFEESLMESQI